MSDPTRVDLRLDPTRQRMLGTTVHKGMRFDVPYITKLLDTLWIGGCEESLVLPEEVSHLVSLYRWGAYRIQHTLKSSLVVSMYDSLEGPDRDQVLGIAEWVNVCRLSGITLVHCQAGLNRSSLIVATVLMLDGWSAERAIEVLRKERSPAVLCNQAFEDWLMEMERYLYP